MPGILIGRGGYLREILRLLGAPAWDCQWLVTGLECYDTCGWEGCEKWGQETLLLSNGDFLRDVEERDMQFVWGILSAIPAKYTREEIFAHPLPDFTDDNGRSLYLREHLLPQHPLAFLEIISEDSTSITVVAPEPAPLQPLYSLDCWTEDAEECNRRFLKMEAAVEKFVTARGYGKMNDHTRRNLLYIVWHSLYHHRPEKPIRAEEVRQELERMLRREREDTHV